VQDYSQLKKDYGQEQAEVIMNIIGNVISGQVNGDTAEQLSDRFGQIMQDRQSWTISSDNTSTNKSTQLGDAIPVSTISALSSGEFVGMVADDPDCKIRLKVFHNEIQNDHDALKKEEQKFKPIPIIKRVTAENIEENYLLIKADIKRLINDELLLLNQGHPENNTELSNNSFQHLPPISL